MSDFLQPSLSLPGTPPCRNTDVITFISNQSVVVRVPLICLCALVGVIVVIMMRKGQDRGQTAGRIQLLACVMHSRKHGDCSISVGKLQHVRGKTHNDGDGGRGGGITNCCGFFFSISVK